jgi:hypothetical protein
VDLELVIRELRNEKRAVEMTIARVERLVTAGRLTALKVRGKTPARSPGSPAPIVLRRSAP